ncbi:MAG: sulfite exporter TauE/SafE family protein [Alphaproteobacteria bacterium]|nr:sulfite exporter TauE/SafE family protein [Alphaproteobacteria bacterium]
MSVTAGELLWLAFAVIAAGVVTGLLAGVFGVGGGAVVVPVLFEVFRIIGVTDSIRLQLCIGTSLAVIGPTAWRSYRAHRARGAVVSGVLNVWLVPTSIGVGVGSAIASVASGGALKIAFLAIASIIAARLLFGGERWRLSENLPPRPVMIIYGFLIGLGSSLMGISGGSLATFALTLHGRSIHQAVATSAGVGVPIAFAGTLGYIIAGLPHHALLPPFSFGFVSLIGVAAIAPIASLVSPVGARIAHALPPRWLEIGFALFLLTVALRLVASMFV